MTDSSAVAASPAIVSNGNWPWRIAIVALLTALADWLFFRRFVGVSFVLFIFALGVAVLLANRTGAGLREHIIYAGILIVALLPSIEDINAISALMAVLGIACFALGVTAALKGGAIERLGAVGSFLIGAPFQFVRDLPLLREWANRLGMPASLSAAKGWIVPLALGAVFVLLFAAANPLIGHWLAQWSVSKSLDQFDMQRLMFWILVGIAVWGFVRVCGRTTLIDLRAALDQAGLAGVAPPDLATGIPRATDSNPIFNDAAIMRSLVLFNLLFAVQTVMDIHYLWRGAALPDGMSYATYAHRGAYPLIVTALLAAAFVIVAMRPGSGAERSPRMRALVFLWVAQNVLLVVSAMLRLNLYVSTYLLTYWRIAAFIWMLIVAIGLILIVVRIVTYRSNAWLVSANAVVLALTIYVCSFVNFANLVATYNVSRGRDARPIDVAYLAALGPQAIPAIDRYLADYPLPPRSYLPLRREWLAADHFKDSANWRAWTFRGWRLSRYLEASKRAGALTPP
jgi:hypothetical protein